MTETAPQTVLDASSILAWLFGEPGGEEVRMVLRGSAVSAVNWSEVLQKAASHGVPSENVMSETNDLAITVVPFGAEDAARAAALWAATHTLGLSFADRACLALGLRLSAPILTADRAWSELPGEFKVRVLNRAR